MKESFLWIVFLASQNVQLTTALGVLSLRLVSYSNPEGKTTDGSCCEHIFAIFGCASGDCDPSFTICIHDSTQAGSCSNLQYRVGPYDNTGSVSFGPKVGALDNPIQVQFQIWKSQFSVSIDVYDDDSDGGHDQIGTTILTPSDVPGYNGSNTAYTETLQGGYARLQVQYDIHCLVNYYGKDCAKLCEPDRTHYVCDGQGNKVCLSGWTGNNCLTSIDDCQDSFCLNSATCEDLHNAYRCHCSEYYTGSRCEIKTSKENAVNESAHIYTSESTDETTEEPDETGVTITIDNYSSTQQSLDHINMFSTSVTNPIEEISSMQTGTELNPVNSSEFTFSPVNEITVTHYEEVTGISTLYGMEVISSSNEATGENHSSNLMEVTDVPNGTSPNENFETSTFDKTDDLTEPHSTTDNIQLIENNYTAVDIDITTKTVPIEINETLFSHELTFASHPLPTETMSTEVLGNIDLSFPSNAGLVTESTKTNTYSASFNFALSTELLEMGESSTMSIQTELSGREEVRQNESTNEFSSQDLFEASTNILDVSSTDTDFQSSYIVPDNITFTPDEMSTTLNPLFSDRVTEETRKTESGLEIIYPTSVTNLSTVLGVTAEQTTNDVATLTTDLSGSEVTSVSRAESSSKPRSTDSQASSPLIMTSTEGSSLEIFTSTMDMLNLSPVTNTKETSSNSKGSTNTFPFHTTDNDRSFTSPSLPNLIRETVDTGSTFTSSDNAHIPSLSTTNLHEIEMASTQSVVLSSSSSQELKEIQNATNARTETTNTNPPPESTSNTIQTSSETTRNERTSETKYISLPQQTNAHTESSSLTATNKTMNTPPTPTKDVDPLETQDRYMSSAKSIVEHTTLPNISESQTVFTGDISSSDLSGQSTARYPSQTLFVKTSEQVQTNFESSTLSSKSTDESSTIRQKPATPLSATPNISSLTCLSKYFVDAIGELVIEVSSEYDFPVVEKEMLKTLAEYGVSDKEVNFNYTSLDSIHIVWLRFNSRTLPLKIREIQEIALKTCRSLQYRLNDVTQHESNKELSSGAVAAITVSLLYLTMLLVIATILIYRKYKRRNKIGSTSLLSEKTCTTRATMETTLETESEC